MGADSSRSLLFLLLLLLLQSAAVLRPSLRHKRLLLPVPLIALAPHRTGRERHKQD